MYKKRKLSSYFLLIDEVHYIMNNYLLRKDAIGRLLKQYTLFDRWCFMTATPNDSEFMLQELKGIQVETAPFKLEKVKALTIQTIQVQATTRKFILDYLKNRLQNAHIFCNSVEIIASLIKACELNNNNCRVVWSKGNKKYKRTILGITRSEVGDEAKKINFYTSTCFEGSDIYDTEGQYIVVSDGSKAHTLNDISTSFKQIIGRIRDTKYREFVTHIFKETRYSEFKTYDEYKERTVRIKKEAEGLISHYNKLKEISFKEGQLNDSYITKSNGRYEIDNNLITYDLMKYKLAMETYASISIVKEEQEKAGFESSIIRDWVEPSDLIKRNMNSRTKFKDAFEEYTELKANTTPDVKAQFKFISKVDQERLELLEEKYPIMKDAYNLLGVEEVRRLKYVQTNIKREINAKSNKSNQNKIFKILSDDGFKPNIWISRADCKRKIQNAYNAVKIDKTAKATDIDGYFEADEKSKRIDVEGSSKVVKGFHIIRERFLFK